MESLASDLPTAGHRVSVLVELPRHSQVDSALSYASDLPLAAGQLVRVPLGRRTVCGIAWAEAEPQAPDIELRPVAEVLDALPPLGPPWRALVSFAAAYYQRSTGELALSVLPGELRDLDATQLQRRLKRLHKRLAAEPIGQVDVPAYELLPLSAEQQAVLQALAGAEPGTHLLHGVTGSGKTEVYLRCVADVLAQGRQALVLVPEINLTPQLEARFRARFPARRIVSLHSGLTPAERLQSWLAAHLGLADVVLGTRMAIFASLPRLGLIVVDEEHDPSYKQQEGARYSARDLAVWRGRNEALTVLLGSATPSLETWHNASPTLPGGARYQLLAMPSRIGAGSLPTVRLVDLARIAAQFGQGAVHKQPLVPALVAALKERIERGEQSLILLNRRGYAPVLHCTGCGWKSACPHCSAWRVFHKLDRTLRCHHCGFSERVPRACPDCGDPDIQPVGRGTERLEEQLGDLLPGARIGRIDADSTRAKGSLESQLASVHAGEVDVLVGTQMVAKGHDFRRMTLVAAVNADSALFGSDFRAPERLFSLLMQAGGRAGRDAAQAGRSELWIQTWHVGHPLYAALVSHDYAAFAKSQLIERQQAGLPPFAHLALLRCEARSQQAATAFLDRTAELGAQIQADHPALQDLLIYPPVPPAIQRVANVERAQMLIESPSRVVLQRFLARWVPQLNQCQVSEQRILRWAVDVDPLAI
ncbi:primosomal protein N' [Leptothrix cholodnii SP-6]|uniref:Replication restart protein PriA n=1 Tax=Leptothrix cholodnii (strain ATCC 51168 / LMG 8142 / SP-6) TaxID=395495 RepID=B1Y3S4_LEPCP|nr:primosomal protein N' [Leptothrix cholodnii]ACB35777.1 primosomal protein N' [Leptothrix cholodnii SP-6]